MENLPTDILENILFQLPVPVMLQDRRVCTAWEALLRNYKFDKPGYLFSLGFDDDDEHGQLFYGEPYDDHVNKNYYDTFARMEPHRFTMKNLDKDFPVGSCNGLLSSSSSKCFGYCHSTKEYKVVTIYKQQDDDGHVQVYTVGSGKWKYITSIPACESSIQGSSGVYANGALHRLHYSPKLEVLAISLKDNKSYSIPFPKDANHCRGYISFKLLGERNIELSNKPKPAD
ncbi:uncharacterized protein LOC113315500 [Papaver somniferum]|uniref:uncharacterized protein LOC113315500 n=1 Tax=Papaver somniferum TaxID=3469 RepID=UPI000E704113|nr:uncharacterized protein LOC113315500 [Papaver somniferum]